MPVTFGAEEPLSVSILIDLAADDVQVGLMAYRDERLTASQLRKLANARSTACRLLAYYTDGDGFGELPADLLKSLWNISQMASDVLEAYAMQIANAEHKCVKLRQGRYLVSRSIPVDPAIERSIECNNPAYADKILDQWEAQVRAAFIAVAERKLASAA
jgi:hypothetical protein